MAVIGKGSAPLILELQHTLKKNANEINNKIQHLHGNATFVTQWVKNPAKWNRAKTIRRKGHSIFFPSNTEMISLTVYRITMTIFCSTGLHRAASKIWQRLAVKSRFTIRNIPMSWHKNYFYWKSCIFFNIVWSQVVPQMASIMKTNSSKHKTTSTLEQSTSKKKMEKQTFLAKNHYNKTLHAQCCRADIIHKDTTPICKYTFFQKLKQRNWKISSAGMQL